MELKLKPLVIHLMVRKEMIELQVGYVRCFLDHFCNSMYKQGIKGYKFEKGIYELPIFGEDSEFELIAREDTDYVCLKSGLDVNTFKENYPLDEVVLSTIDTYKGIIWKGKKADYIKPKRKEWYQ